MSAGQPSEKRTQPRVNTVMDMALSDMSGKAVDSEAKAHDLSPSGFRAEIQCRLKEGSRFKFKITLPDGSVVRGQAVASWCSQDQWGSYLSGFKIIEMSWADRRLISRQAGQPYPYDLFRILAMGSRMLFYLVILLAARNIIFRQPHVREVLWQVLPEIAALAVMCFGLSLILSRRF
ncbi:MAG: PilZ domain-containing protein [Elusimicrobia bacterium]|nr:PilZ domain-containing protein [Elusimicrobiota bacterium]